MNAKNRTRRLCSDFNRNYLREALLYNSTHDSAWPWRWRANNKLGQNRVSLKDIFMCGVSTQEWPSTQTTLIERTRQSAWLDTVTSFTRRSELLCTKPPFFEGWRELSNQKNHPKTQKCSLRRATNVTVSKKFSCHKRNPALRFFETFAVLINSWVNSGPEKLFSSLDPFVWLFVKPLRRWPSREFENAYKCWKSNLECLFFLSTSFLGFEDPT